MVKIELERELENRCVAKVEAIGGKALKLKLEGVRGFPDRMVLLPPKGKHISGDGRVFFVEFKRAKVGVTSRQQVTWGLILGFLGFHTYNVDTDAEFDAILEDWK